MDNRKIKYLLITIIALSVLVIGGTFSYFTSTVNTLNNGDTSISTRDIGSIKYTGIFALNTTDFYPGSIGVTKFTIEKDTPTGTGYYEIDLDSVVDLAYQNDLEISLYKTTDEANNNISVTEGNITNANNQYMDTDTLVINGTPELVYGPEVLQTASTLALEQTAFDCETLQPTTYYLVYKYKNNGNQNNQQGKTFTSEVSVRLIDSLSDTEETEPSVPELTKRMTATSEGITIIRNGTSYLIKRNNWSVEKNHIQQIFSDISCDVNSSRVRCNASDFYCYVNSDGYVSCDDYSTNESCRVNSFGSVDCS